MEGRGRCERLRPTWKADAGRPRPTREAEGKSRAVKSCTASRRGEPTPRGADAEEAEGSSPRPSAEGDQAEAEGSSLRPSAEGSSPRLSVEAKREPTPRRPTPIAEDEGEPTPRRPRGAVRGRVPRGPHDSMQRRKPRARAWPRESGTTVAGMVHGPGSGPRAQQRERERGQEGDGDQSRRSWA